MAYLSPQVIARLNELNIESVATALGISVVRHKAKCFMHHDHHPSLSFHPRGHIWKCFVCDIGGGPIQLVMRYNNWDFVEACKWLCNIFGIHYFSDAPKYRRQRVRRVYENAPKSSDFKLFNVKIGEWLLNNSDLTSKAKEFLFKERRLSERVIEDLNIKSLPDSKTAIKILTTQFSNEELEESGYLKNNEGRLFLRIFTPCLLFPYYDVNQKLIGIQSRYLGEIPSAPRFQFSSGLQSTLFNQPILNSLSKGDELYIAEGVTDCLALLSTGLKAIAIPSASNIPLDELSKILKFKLFMSVDRGDAGESAFSKLRYHIVKMGGNIRRFHYPEEFGDYSDYYKSTN